AVSDLADGRNAGGGCFAMTLVPTGPSPLAIRRPSFFGGMYAMLGGVGFGIGAPSLWPPALVPVFVAAIVMGGLGVLAVKVLPGAVAAWLGGGVLGVVVTVAAIVIGLVLAVLGGVALAQPLSGPALNAIVRRAEAAEGAAPLPPTRFFDDVIPGISSVALAYTFGLPLLAILFALSFTPAAPVAWVLKVIVLDVMIAWDLCDYPLAQRGWSIGARLSFV